MATNLVQLEADHPGFNDQDYRARRNQIAELALNYEIGQPLPRIEFNDNENATWQAVFERLTQLYPTHACEEYNRALVELEFTKERIPQLADLSEALEARTGFRICPVAGLVEPADFFGMLADRIFPSTQYIRHHSVPHYTPEPDTVHDLLGHIPMLAIPEYADLTQKLGEGARGATEEQVAQVARLYWYTIEFGLVRQRGELRCYGAGCLSSFGEMERAVKGEEPEIRRFDPAEARYQDYPITTYQPVLWEVCSIREAFYLVAAAIERIRHEA